MCIIKRFARFVELVKDVVKINKAVLGSSHGDMPKYAGDGVALHGTPGFLGVPLLHALVFLQLFLGNFGEVHFRCGASKARHLIC